jgi:D-beta-D-heptose 7-phosphate kinase/D-beta-D-heptose 1-phosphate adenosyltransferase
MFNRYKCDPEDLIRSIRNFRGKRILVVGDLMLDRFIWGSVSRISRKPRFPVVEIRKESTCLGGAANVATNIRSLGGTPVPLGILGDDFEGKRLREEFRRLGSPLGGLIVEKGRPTSIKTRIIAHHQQVCRTDREDRSPIPASLQSRIADRFRAALPSVDAVVVSDYAKGLITAPLLKQILPLAKAARKIVCIDPKLRDFSVYRPATIITPNAAEAEHASGVTISGTQELIRAGKKILRQSGIEHLLITRGEEGMALFESNSRVTHIPTVAQEVFDVTGAGDTVISTLALSLVSGLSMLAAAVLSNIAAGIVVGKLGTASATPDELTAAIRNL